ncbi:MAG: efflux RND transporter permease subunit [Campylobacterales bacterium]|nr:efflux RND transporter permease subunit [Campylobacterales bacterium]
MVKQSKLEQLIYSTIQTPLRRAFVYLITLIIFMASVMMIPTEIVKAKMLPGKDSDSFSVYVDLPKGASEAQTKEVTTCISNELIKEPFVIGVSTFLGEGQPLDFAGMVKGSALKNSENKAEMMVNIKRKEERDIMSYNLVHKIRPQIQAKCSKYDANIKFIELPAGPPVLASIVSEIYGGKSYDSRLAFAKEIADVLKKQKKLVDVDVLADKIIGKYELEIDNNKVIESGIGLDQVKKVLYVAFEGSDMGVVNKNNVENQLSLFVRLDDSRLLDEGSEAALEKKLSQLMLINPNGMTLPMSRFVTVKKSFQDPAITSKDLSNMINVVAETDMESQIYPLLDARKYMLNNMSDKYEVTPSSMLNLEFKDKKTGEVFKLVWDGELKVTIDTFIELGGAFIGALVLIFFLMVIYYKNFALAGGIVLASFLSLIGVIFGHFVMDKIAHDTFYLTATSLIGYIGLIGINSRNSLLIIDFAKQLVEHHNMEVKRAIAVATKTRAKPILLTVLAIVFASSLLATDAVFGGLGVALIGGTLAAYVVSIFFVPSIITRALENIYSKRAIESV